MTDAVLGRRQIFKIGPAANNLTDVAREGDGLSEPTINETNAVREIPGGSPTSGDSQAVQRQSLERLDGTLAFSIDANTVSMPLLWGKNGQRLYFERGIDGDGGGKPKETGSVYAQISVNGPTNDAVRFTVSGDFVDGLEKTTY